MAILILDNISKAVVVGPLQDDLSIFDKVEPLLDQYDLVVFNGGLVSPLDQIKTNFKMRALSSLLKSEKTIYNITGEDYLASSRWSEVEDWLVAKPNAINIKFERGTNILIIGGGISPEIKEFRDLNDNLELSFVKKVNNKPWHESYNGRFGYVISNYPTSTKEPNFFSYSAQIGVENKVYAQEIVEHGLGETFLL